MNIDLVRFLNISLVALGCLMAVTACTSLPADLFGQGPADAEVSEAPILQTVQCEEPRP